MSSPLIEHLKVGSRVSRSDESLSGLHRLTKLRSRLGFHFTPRRLTQHECAVQARERVVDLAELSMHISEIAQDQYGSRSGDVDGGFDWVVGWVGLMGGWQGIWAMLMAGCLV